MGSCSLTVANDQTNSTEMPMIIFLIVALGLALVAHVHVARDRFAAEVMTNSAAADRGRNCPPLAGGVRSQNEHGLGNCLARDGTFKFLPP
jgi:hypothetical protein